MVKLAGELGLAAKTVVCPRIGQHARPDYSYYYRLAAVVDGQKCSPGRTMADHPTQLITIVDR
jgi:hypothetical protein